MFEVDSNMINTEPIQDQSTGKMIQAYHKLWQWLMVNGMDPMKHFLENEASEEFKAAIRVNSQL